MNRDLKRRRRPQPKFVLCIKNKDCEDLEVRKMYRVLPDRTASQDDLLRIVDESGEDYLYPAAYFIAIELPSEIEKALPRQLAITSLTNSCSSVRGGAARQVA